MLCSLRLESELLEFCFNPLLLVNSKRNSSESQRITERKKPKSEGGSRFIRICLFVCWHYHYYHCYYYYYYCYSHYYYHYHYHCNSLRARHLSASEPSSLCVYSHSELMCVMPLGPLITRWRIPFGRLDPRAIEPSDASAKRADKNNKEKNSNNWTCQSVHVEMYHQELTHPRPQCIACECAVWHEIRYNIASERARDSAAPQGVPVVRAPRSHNGDIASAQLIVLIWNSH